MRNLPIEVYHPTDPSVRVRAKNKYELLNARRNSVGDRVRRPPKSSLDRLVMSASRSTVDPYGNSVSSDEARKGRETGLCPLPNYSTYFDLGFAPDRSVGGWDKDGVSTLFVAEHQAANTTYVYRDGVQVGSFNWTDIYPATGNVYRAVDTYVIHFGLLLVAARRYEASVIKGVSLLWSHDYGATWSVQDFAGLPGYDGADRLNHWCIGQPYPTAIGSDSLSADLVFTDYMGKSGNPNGGQVFFFPLRRSSLTDNWTVHTGRMIWEDQKTGDTGRHFHTAAVVRGSKTGVIVHIGDVDYRNEIVFLDYDVSLENYLTASVSSSTIYGGWSSDSTLVDVAPQPVGAQPGPDLKTHIASGDETNPVVASISYDDDGLVIRDARRELAFVKSGVVWDAPAYLSSKYCAGGGWYLGGGYVSKDGRIFAHAPVSGILGSKLYRINGTVVETADWSVIPVRPLLVSRGGTNTTKTDIPLSGNPAPSTGATRRKVNYDGTEYRYDDDNSLLSPQPPKAPFVVGTPIYHHQFTGGRTAGNMYPNTEAFSWVTVNSLRMFAFDMANNGITLNTRGGFGTNMATENGHVVNANKEWVDISLTINVTATGTGTIRHQLYGANGSTDDAQNNDFLVAYAGCEEYEWHTYPMAPQTLTDQPDEQATLPIGLGSSYTVGVAIQRPDGITVKTWGDTLTDRTAGWLCSVYTDANNHIQFRFLDDVTIQARVTIGGVATDYSLTIEAMHQFGSVVLFVESDGSTTTIYARNTKSVTFATATAGTIGNPSEMRFGAADWSMVPDIQILGVYVGTDSVSTAKFEL